MSLLKRFKLYDQKKEWTVTVIPLRGRDGYRLIGIGILKHVQKEVTSDELQEFINLHKLMREEELGQVEIWDLI
ncbi:hypothetical protein [Macrococcoides caseolyticum]|uniref:Uncharacterized protein n=1 Tax=Macrococcoides caseolyticum TaxID=69966 RepID=A0ACC9MV30_9STAP|nr:hypothetical protein [Macrococcus caseolyticus]PKE25133.1 hypothetical protein CW689_01325 [Macrococcus caseolyticus]PKE39528.1 hypothetical protein CW675_06185 [Macrococcus caseolyticus]PKE56761.1 hypothetical protein CW682_04410 [Macrococcus caseolyticus]QYA36379.1 hypothetical protein KYI08_05790 [Macrococcus caseolyticus]